MTPFLLHLLYFSEYNIILKHIFYLGGISLDNNSNLDMDKLMSMLSNMDKSQLEEGLAKASKILENNNKEEILKNINNSNNSNINNKSNSSNSQNFNMDGIDFETILKMKNMINSMNTKDDPRSNLLQSLKPYLNDSRKSKVDQYINLMNMSKMLEVFPFLGGDQKNGR